MDSEKAISSVTTSITAIETQGSLDQYRDCGALLTDLSKAFICHKND